VSKRTLIIAAAVLVLGAFLSACGSNKLAPELTPIPTLPAGQTPTLVAALQASAATEQAATPEAAGGTEQAAASQSAGTEQAAAPASGDAAAGEKIFSETCAVCHGEQNGAGPARVGMGQRAVEHAQDRGQNQTPEEYLHESIVDPHAYVVEGFQPIMPEGYGDQFSEQQINDIVAYLMTQ
jgi:mono/diheme cytochrome c family protein